jgi:exonuclease SbcC
VLFIDEGFGTLDSDYLNTVMEALEKLHQIGGKPVGIISHVEGLKERIKTQIQVRRIDSSRSEIEVVNTL